MATISMKTLLEAGVHFGHQTRRWNPKMQKYIFGQRNDIHIIDLQKTVKELRKACKVLRDVAAVGGRVLFIGTKRQAQEAVRESAARCGEFFVSTRWMGGSLTNFDTIRKSIMRLNELAQWKEDGLMQRLNKQEIARMTREMQRLEKSLAGIRNMEKIPQLLFVVDPVQEAIAIKEAHRMEVPIVAVCDTNCDPDLVDHVIPGNDDAIRSIRLFCSLAADSILEGKQIASQKGEAPAVADGADADAPVDLTDEGGQAPAPAPDGLPAST